MLDWQTTPPHLLADLVAEPRASIYIQGPYPSASAQIDLNCENEIVLETVDGKRRRVPKAAERSLVSLSAIAGRFSDPAFNNAYLHLLADLFGIIGGEYGYAQHIAISPWPTDYDRIHWNPYEPSAIAWANFFGPALVARFGRERLLIAPAHRVWELPGDSIALTVAASPTEQLQPEAQERIAQVKAHLGILAASERAAPDELAAFHARSTAAQQETKQRIEEAFRQVHEQTAVQMQRQAQGCVEGVERYWGERLNFSLQSLAVVDRLIQSGFRSREDEETVAAAVQAFGSYVGEVIRRAYGGVWHDEEMKGQPVLLNVGSGQIRVQPFAAVRERFAQRAAGKGSLQRLAERIGAGA